MAEILSEFGHLVGLVGGNNIQATTMPTYSSVPLGTIVQYIGTTTADYINGYFYKATASGWEQHDTQPASNADNSITAFKESSPALAAHAVDDYIRYNNATYIVTAAIAIGDNLVVGTNIAVPVLDEGTVIYTPEAGGGSAGGGHVIVNPSGTDMEQRASLQFVDANVTDDSNNDKTKIENVKVINSESELTNASDGMYIGSYDDEPEGVLSADMVMYDSETTVEDELDNKVDKVTGKGLSTNDYDNTDKAKVDKIDDTTTAVTGNPISITGLKSNQLAINPIITLEPIQAGSGDPSPSNVRSISGYDKIEVLSCGKNLLRVSLESIKSANTSGTWSGNNYTWNNITYSVLLDSNNNISAIKANGTANDRSYLIICNNLVLADISAEYYLTGYVGTNSIETGISYYFVRYSSQAVANFVTSSSGLKFTPNDGISVVWNFPSGQSASNEMCYPMIRLATIEDDTFEPYNPLTDIQLTFGQTIYGGTLDVEKGILTVDRGVIESPTAVIGGYYNNVGLYLGALDSTHAMPKSNLIPSNVLCNKIKTLAADQQWVANADSICVSENGDVLISAYGITSQENLNTWLTNNAITVVYELKNPYTIQLTPHEISLLKDYAYVSTNGTNMSFSYHNGEIATLGDAESVGETLNAFGNIIPSNASSLNKLVTASENNFTYTNAGVADLNNITYNGTFSVYIGDAAAQHAPDTGYFTITTIRFDNNAQYVAQIINHSATDLPTYVRRCVGGTWENWSRLVKSSEMPIANISGTDGSGLVYDNIGGLANGASMFVAEKTFSAGLYMINIWVNVLNCSATDFPFLNIGIYANGEPYAGSVWPDGGGTYNTFVVPIIGNQKNWNLPIFGASLLLNFGVNTTIKLSVTNGTGQTISNEYATSICGYRYYKIG